MILLEVDIGPYIVLVKFIVLLNVGESSGFSCVEIDRNMCIAYVTELAKMSFDFVGSEIICEQYMY